MLRTDRLDAAGGQELVHPASVVAAEVADEAVVRVEAVLVGRQGEEDPASLPGTVPPRQQRGVVVLHVLEHSEGADEVEQLAGRQQRLVAAQHGSPEGHKPSVGDRSGSRHPSAAERPRGSGAETMVMRPALRSAREPSAASRRAVPPRARAGNVRRPGRTPPAEAPTPVHGRPRARAEPTQAPRDPEQARRRRPRRAPAAGGGVSDVTIAVPAAAPWNSLLGTTRRASRGRRRCRGRRRATRQDTGASPAPPSRST